MTRLEHIARASSELNRCISERGHGDFGATLGELDWITELHRLLYETENEEMAEHLSIDRSKRGVFYDTATPRTFDSGATRDGEGGKLDFEGFFSPLVLERRAQYMDKHRRMKDGTVRDSDNWQKGIPFTAYAKSAWRHFFDFWKQHRGWPGKDTLEDSICALMFNLEGYLHETLKKRKVQ